MQNFIGDKLIVKFIVQKKSPKLLTKLHDKYFEEHSVTKTAAHSAVNGSTHTEHKDSTNSTKFQMT